MPAIKGLAERRHRTFFACTCCGEDVEAQCPECGLWFCRTHLRDHDCVELLKALAERQLQGLIDYGDLIGNALDLAEEWEMSARACAEAAGLDRAAADSAEGLGPIVMAERAHAIHGERSSSWKRCAQELRRALGEDSVERERES